MLALALVIALVVRPRRPAGLADKAACRRWLRNKLHLTLTSARKTPHSDRAGVAVRS
jgi:hypothetical protein